MFIRKKYLDTGDWSQSYVGGFIYLFCYFTSRRILVVFNH